MGKTLPSRTAKKRPLSQILGTPKSVFGDTPGIKNHGLPSPNAFMKNWTVGKRIVVGYTAVLLATLAIGAFALTRLVVIKGHSDSLTSDDLPGVVILSKIQAIALENKAL